jgi:hypothetical protein
MVLRFGQIETKSKPQCITCKKLFESFSHSLAFNGRSLLPLYLVAYFVAKQKISRIIAEILFLQLEWIWRMYFFEAIYHQLHCLCQIVYSTTF